MRRESDSNPVANLLGELAFAIAVVDLLGWNLGLPSWTRWFPDLPRMVPTTALSVALLGAAVPFAVRARAGSAAGRRLALGAATLTMMIAGAALAAYAFGSTLGPERLFLYGRTDVAAAYRGRMSPQTAGALLCVAWSLAVSVSDPPRRRAAQALVTITATLAVIALGGHIHGVARLFGITDVVGMAVPTAISLLALSSAVAALHPDFGIRKLLTEKGPAGRYARHLMLASAVIPFGTAILLRAGENLGWYDANFRSGAYVGAMAVLLFGTAWLATRASQRAEEERANVAEDALRRSEGEARARAAQLEAVLDCIADGVLVYDREGRIARSTPAADRLLRLPEGVRDEPVLERVSKQYEILTEDGRRVAPEDMVAVRAAVRGELVKGTIQQVRSGGGEPRWLLMSGMPLVVDGAHVGAVLSMTDLTDRKRAEEDLALVTRLYAVLSRVNEAIVRIRNEQSLFEAVCRIIGDEGRFPLVWVGLVKGREVSPTAWWGPASEYLRSIRVEIDGELGQGPTGTSVREDRPVINDDFALNPATAPWREASARHGLRASAGFPLHRGGQVVGALTMYGGRAGAFTPAQVNLLEALCADVSYALDAMEQERRRVAAEEALRESERRLREADRRKDEFLGMLSHELRNPLAPIRNSIYILGRAEAGTEQARRARNIIERQAEHLTRLVDDLLDVTRIARGKIELRRAPTDLRDVVLRAAEDFRPLLEERGLGFRMAAPAASVWANVDATRVNQVLGNLLHNAAKFSRRGDEVALVLGAAGGQADITVRDSGSGIEPALLPHVFDAFVQGDRTLSRSDGGLGLGLALVKGIVGLHDGTVVAQSDGRERGATFVIRLPLAPAPSASPPSTWVSAAAPRTRQRVLVVDDNADGANTLAEVVEMLGHAAEVAYDGPSALEKARARIPDLVLCDIGLPGMDGYEVARRLRALGVEGMRLIALSGFAQSEDVRRATEAGFDAHIAKPCEAAEIRRLLS